MVSTMNNEDLLISEVAYMYYNLHYSQDLIAEKLFMSRSTVSRLIKKALESGIVEIKVNLPNKRFSKLENEFKEKFNLKDCHIVETIKNIGFEQLCNYASIYISDFLKDNCTVGISSGKTVHNICDKIEAKLVNNIMFTQVKGSAGIGSEYEYDSPNLILALSNKFSGQYNLIYSPLYVFNKTVRDYLMKELIITNSIDLAKKADLIISSVSTPSDENSRIYEDYINDPLMKEMLKKNPKASFMGHFFDENGEVVDEAIENSIIGLSTEDIRAIKNTIVVVYEEEKSDALLSVLKSGLVKNLIVSKKCIDKINI